MKRIWRKSLKDKKRKEKYIYGISKDTSRNRTSLVQRHKRKFLFKDNFYKSLHVLRYIMQRTTERAENVNKVSLLKLFTRPIFKYTTKVIYCNAEKLYSIKKIKKLPCELTFHQEKIFAKLAKLLAKATIKIQMTGWINVKFTNIHFRNKIRLIDKTLIACECVKTYKNVSDTRVFSFTPLDYIKNTTCTLKRNLIFKVKRVDDNTIS